MSKRLSPSCRLFFLHDKLDDLMEVLVAAKRTAAEEVRFRNVERRYWPVKRELMRRLKERDELVAEKADRVARLQALHASNPGIKPWSSDRDPEVTP